MNTIQKHPVWTGLACLGASAALSLNAVRMVKNESDAGGDPKVPMGHIAGANFLSLAGLVLIAYGVFVKK